MKTPRFLRLTLLVFFALFVLFNSSPAQHFIQMTDQQWVELALDMIRKGVQQQDTTKIFMVCAPEVSIKGERFESKASLSRKLQSIFDDSSKRKSQLEKPAFSRDDNPLYLSNFWDFDILDAQIQIEGDSAMVDCELVLWGAPSTQGSDQRGRRTKESFVFKMPPEIEKAPPSGDYRMWPASPSGKKQMGSLRSWKLVRLENLLDFLNDEINSPHE